MKRKLFETRKSRMRLGLAILSVIMLTVDMWGLFGYSWPDTGRAAILMAFVTGINILYAICLVTNFMDWAYEGKQ